MINTLVTAIKIALFVWFLAIMTSLVGLGSKILNVPAPTLPSVPAFSFQVEAGGDSTGKGEVSGSLAFDFSGGSQTASQAVKASLSSYHASQGGKASLNNIITSKGGKVNLSTNTTASKLGADISAPGRAFFVPKSDQSLGR